jgi:hypothetical protein
LKEKINLANRALIGDTEAIKKINTWFWPENVL